MDLIVEKGVNIVDFLSEIEDASIENLYVYELPNDFLTISSIIRVGKPDAFLHIIKNN